ncbi:MAG TPA: serine/threonine-protein kinase [Phycisphaerales bacterium]|nr:serine/threonine-protein kinase [Phycisphaerales bacterium]
MSIDHARARSIFDAAMDQPGAARDAFIASQCGTDAALLAHVRKLVAAEATAGGFLEEPAIVQAAMQDAKSFVGRKIGRYTLTKLLGQGGMGRVYEAQQEQPRRTVAVKIIGALPSTEAKRRFRYESEVLARLRHPGIAQIFEASSHIDDLTGEELPYFVMEHIPDGAPLTHAAELRRLLPADRVRLMLEACEAVQHAHRRGVIHRDIKPGNLLVEQSGHVKVIDFGIARVEDPTVTAYVTQTGQLVGTLSYMSPEQCSGDPRDVDVRSDVYSLGVVLYELLAGKLPYDVSSTSTLDAARIIREVEPQRFNRETLAQGKDLEAVVFKALAKDREDRYQSVQDFADDLRRWLEHAPVTARPPSAVRQLRHVWRRHRVPVTAGLLLVIMMAVGTVAFGWLYGRAERERKVAAAEAAKASAALHFVEEMFDSIDPDVAKGDAVTVREVLDVANTRLKRLPPTDPDVDVTLRNILGTAYYKIGDYKTSEGLFEYMGNVPAGDGDIQRRVLSLQVKHASALLSQSRVTEADAILRRAYEDQRRAFGQTDRDTLESMSLLARVLQEQEKMDDAASMLREVVSLQTQVLGASHRDTLESRCNLADFLHQYGDLGEAEQVISGVVADAQAALGQDDTMTLQALSIQGSIFMQLGKDAEAEHVLQETVAGKRRVLGPMHDGTMLSENALAMAMANNGKRGEAIELLRSLVERITQREGPEDSTTLTYTNNLAQELRREKRFDEAEPLYRHVLEVARRTAGPTDRSTLTYANNLGMLQMEKGDPEGALPNLRECLEGLKATLPPDHWMLGASMGYTAECLLALGRVDEGVPMMEEAYTRLAKSMGDTNPRTLRPAQALADHHSKAGDTTKAAEWRAKASAK